MFVISLTDKRVPPGMGIREENKNENRDQAKNLCRENMCSKISVKSMLSDTSK